MIVVPSLDEINAMHARAIHETGGSLGIRDQGALASAAAQPTMTFGGDDLYPTLAEKAAALAFSLVNNHAYVDGNKRVGYIAMRFMLVVNGYDLTVDEFERECTFLALADGSMSREELVDWIENQIQPIP